jgi:hypothetical protein
MIRPVFPAPDGCYFFAFSALLQKSTSQACRTLHETTLAYDRRIVRVNQKAVKIEPKLKY